MARNRAGIAGLDRDLKALRVETLKWLVAGLLLAVVAMALILALGMAGPEA